MAAERQSLVAERRALNARLNSQSVHLSLQRVELEEATAMIGILQNDLASLETAMKGKDPFGKVLTLAPPQDARLRPGTNRCWHQ